MKKYPKSLSKRRNIEVNKQQTSTIIIQCPLSTIIMKNNFHQYLASATFTTLV